MGQALEVIAPEAEQLEKESSQIVAHGKMLALAIKDQASLQEAASFYFNTGKKIQQIEKFFSDPEHPKQKTYAAWKSLCGQESALLNPLKEVFLAIKKSMGNYEAEQELLRAAEAERLRKEQQQKLDDAKLEEAAALSESGEHDAAEEVLSTPSVVATPTMSRPATAGVKTFRDKWTGNVTNLTLLCKAIAEGKASSNLVIPNQTAINKYVEANKMELRIPGVEPKKEKIPVRG